MKQRVTHGAELDVATPQEIAQIFAAAFSGQKPEEYRRFKGVVNLDATGAGRNDPASLTIDAPAQYDLELQRVTIGGPGAAAALVCLYENSNVSDADMLEAIVVGANGKYSDSFSNNIIIGSNSVILIVVTGGVANSQITFNLQGRLIKHS